MTYTRVTHSSPFSDGSATDLTVLLGAMATGLEAAESTIAGHTTSIATETTRATAAETTISSGATSNSGTLWTFVGDSITNGSSASNFAYSFAPIAIANVGGLIARRDSYEAGNPGERADQMLARSSTWLGYGASGYVILAGTNDAGQGTSLDITVNSLIGMIQKIKATGAAVVICTVPPRGSSASSTIQQATVAINHWIKTQAPRYGAVVADTYTVLVSNTSGLLAAGYDSGDGVHPNDNGHQAMAVEVARAMRKTTNRVTPYGLVTTNAGANLISDPLNTRTTPTSSPWFEQPGGTGSTPTYSMQNDTTGLLPAGSWAEMDFNNSSGVSGLRRLATNGISSGFSAGDKMLVTFHAQIVDVSGSWVSQASAATANFQASVINQAGSNISGSQTIGISHAAGVPIAATSPTIYEYGPQAAVFTVPSGTTNMNVWFQATVPTGYEYKFRVGCVGLYNLTSMGLASYYEQGSVMINN